MKRKLFFMMGLLIFVISVLGCDSSFISDVKHNVSEWAKVYFFGENEEFYCNISSGMREKEYFMDGQATGCVDYALVSLYFFNQDRSGVISVEISIDGDNDVVEMEYNSLNGKFMVDLERRLLGQENVNIKFTDKELALNCLSNEFNVSYNDALEIGSKEMEDKILLKKEYSKLNCEIYLRILDNKANSSNEIFWCFTVLNSDNENYSVVISTKDGTILAKST